MINTYPYREAPNVPVLPLLDVVRLQCLGAEERFDAVVKGTGE